MWDEFKQQAQELQQQLADKHAVAADRDAARAELGRVQELLQQQRQLQDAYVGQQQLLLSLQQQQQQHGLTPRQQQQQQGWPTLESQDCLDAFVVETQLVGGGCCCCVCVVVVLFISVAHLRTCGMQTRWRSGC